MVNSFLCGLLLMVSGNYQKIESTRNRNNIAYVNMVLEIYFSASGDRWLKILCLNWSALRLHLAAGQRNFSSCVNTPHNSLHIHSIITITIYLNRWIKLKLNFHRFIMFSGFLQSLPGLYNYKHTYTDLSFDILQLKKEKPHYLF